MKRFAQVLAVLIALLGLRFALIAPREFTVGAAPWPTGFWLVNSSVLFLICGALTFLRTHYGSELRGLSVVGVAANALVAALILVAGIIGGEATPSIVVAAVLVIAAAVPIGVRRAA